MAIEDRLLRKAVKYSEKTFANNRSDYGELGKSYNGKSIKTMTKDLIMQFPLLISEQISYKTAQMLAEGFERENALLVKLLLMNDLGQLTKDLDKDNVGEVFKKIHTNIDSNPLNENSLRDFHNACLKQLIPIEEKFNQFSLNEGTLPKYLNEVRIETHYTQDEVRREIERDLVTGRDREVRNTYSTEKDRTTELNFSDKSSFKPELFDKINKMAPTMIEMNIHKYEGDTERSPINTRTSRTTRDVSIVFGVKCVVHQLKSDDIVHNIQSSATNNTLFKFIKWTTGEYSFVKGLGEILFDFSRSKSLGVQAAKTSNYWWFKLRKLKMGNKARFFSGSKSVAPTKTATLILSKEEIDYIYTNYRIDLKQTKPAYKLMNDLFLLTFGYVDESTETVYLFDEVSKSYLVKNYDDFKSKTKNKALNIDDIKSLFGR